MRHRALFVLLLAASGPSRRMSAQGTHPADTSAHDSAYSAMQERGQMVMGVDQYTSIHHFDDLPNGGRITLVRAADDTAGASASSNTCAQSRPRSLPGTSRRRCSCT